MHGADSPSASGLSNGSAAGGRETVTGPTAYVSSGAHLTSGSAECGDAAIAPPSNAPSAACMTSGPAEHGQTANGPPSNAAPSVSGFADSSGEGGETTIDPPFAEPSAPDATSRLAEQGDETATGPPAAADDALAPPAAAAATTAGGEPGEPVYCLCQQVSHGDMVACDGPARPARKKDAGVCAHGERLRTTPMV